MIVTKSTGEPRITITLNQDEANVLNTYLFAAHTVGWPTIRELGQQLKKAVAPEVPPEICDALLLGKTTCGKPAVTKWKVTCINDLVRTKSYCTQHGATRDAVEQLNCTPCKAQGSYHKVVGVAEVKI